MPYIKEENKLQAMMSPTTSGMLNYKFTKTALAYLEHNGKNYEKINDIIGALEACKLEFYRRLVAEYENEKIQQNGDAYK